MPFTVSHMAVTLPFSKNKKELFIVPAIAIGSMAPDFEYFFRTRMYGVYGHTLKGVFFLDLPLVIVTYFVCYYFIFPTVTPYLPRLLQFNQKFINCKSIAFWMKFLLSGLIGIFSHIFIDSFTHKSGFMVDKISLLQIDISFFNLQIPIYKFLQYGLGILGLMLVLVYVIQYHTKMFVEVPVIPIKKKFIIWFAMMLLTLCIFTFWSLGSPISISQYGTQIVRIIDSFILSVLFLMGVIKIQSILKKSNIKNDLFK